MAKATPASSAPNPFTTARRKAPAGSKKSDANIITACDFVSYNGGAFSKNDVVQALDAYCEGHTMFEQGKAMKDTNRPTLLYLARTMFAKDWLMQGTRPKNPKVCSTEDGRGRHCAVLFFDSANKLDNGSFASLANLIGRENADALTIQRDDFTLNPELLYEKVKVKGRNGKEVEMVVMDAIAEAIQDKFAPSPEIARDLFTITPMFTTSKGMIDKGPQLVCPDKSPASAARLAQFLELGRFTTQIKPGASGTETAAD
jgi:hypothetical protein